VTRRALEQREITRIAGTNGDALRSIENMPGVARPPFIAGGLIIRGSAPADTDIFVDGTAIPIAYHFGGLSSVIPSELLTRIDFYPGNFGPEYSRALGGWTLATTLATIASSIIYGLRRDVKAAREFGQYQLLEKIGEGGMGAVYRARHRMLRRDTALKLLPPTRSSAAAIARFEREVRLTAQLRHPNTVTIFDYGRTPDGVFYYTMELLEGATLEEIVRSTEPMPAGRVAWILRQVAGALAEAHDLGLVHRDVKPSNIMLGMRGGQPDVAKVLDFGLAREQLDEAAHAPTDLLGTPQYMSPEAIALPSRVSPASDLYSLGAVAYYLLAGAPPFEAKTIVEMCTQHMYSEPAPLSARGTVPPEIEVVVLAMLAKEPAVRPASATALLEWLERLPPFPWSEADARSWWREHGARIRPRIHEVPRAPEQTLDVDLARRLVAEAETLMPVSVRN